MTAEMREIKAPSKSRLKQKRPINSIVVYKDWIYCASDMVEGSNFKVCIKNHRAGPFFFWYVSSYSSFDWRNNSGVEKTKRITSFNRNGETDKCAGTGSCGGLHVPELQLITN